MFESMVVCLISLGENLKGGFEFEFERGWETSAGEFILVLPECFVKRYEGIRRPS